MRELTSSIFGTGGVVALVETTVGGHLNKVQSTVQTARKLGNINIEGEFLSDDVEHLVFGVGLHEVGSGSDVGGVGALCNELEGKSISAGADTVGARVVSAIDSTCLRTSGTVFARGSIPCIVRIAVRVAGSNVGPSPVGIDGNGTALGCARTASCSSTGLPGHLRVGFGLLLTDLLSAGGSEEGERCEGE
jgi:hypothetical protein